MRIAIKVAPTAIPSAADKACSLDAVIAAFDTNAKFGPGVAASRK